MLELLVGKKGTGKTKNLVDGVNKAQEEAKGNVVFITNCTSRNMYDIKSSVRMVNAGEFGMKSYAELSGFVEGVISSNFDITNIFIDGIFKIVGTQELDGMQNFVERLDAVGAKFGVDFVVSLSMDADSAPDYIKKYMKEI